VWGHHTHVLQAGEWVETSQGKTLVLYSLGNALFDQGGLADTRQSALALVEVNPDGVQSIRIVPFVIDVPNSRLEAPNAETAKKILDRIKIK
jgi:poly-gamma-glutamate capsule biosynthesis protein CapA/YwtB (metallophosphatase superfamily)